MAGLNIITWFWGHKYGESYIQKLKRGIARNVRQPYRFIVVRPDSADPLLKIQGCFVRLRMFDRAWQASMDIGEGERIACLDLDAVVTGPMDDVFNRTEDFVILGGANSSNPCPFNGSIMMLRAGAHQDVWSDFSLDKAQQVPFHEFPDDQGWIWHKLPNAATWRCGRSSGIYAFKKPGWHVDDFRLPEGARLVVFPGRRDPGQFKHLPWVNKHWNTW